MNLKELKTEEIKVYIQAGKAKGRFMKEIVKEIAEVRSDVTVLFHDPTTAN